MRKDSLIILVISIVLTLGIVGGAHYLYLQEQKRVSSSGFNEPSSVVRATQPNVGAVQPASRRTAIPIKCTKLDRSVFWTNASRCEDADLNNRLSFADPVKPVPRKQNKRAANNSSASVSLNRKKLKRITNDLSIPCRYSIGMARKIETRSLSLKSDPAESIWKGSYCRWVCEARVENCGNLDDYLNLVNLCLPLRNMSKRACATLD